MSIYGGNNMNKEKYVQLTGNIEEDSNRLIEGYKELGINFEDIEIIEIISCIDEEEYYYMDGYPKTLTVKVKYNLKQK